MIRNEEFSKKQLTLSISLVLFIIIIFSVKLFRMQIIDNDKFSLRTMRIIYRDDPIAAQRGRILARDGKTVLADNKAIYEIVLDFSLFPDERKIEILNRLAKGCHIDPLMLLQYYQEALDNNEDQLIIKEKADFQDIVFLSENQDFLPGIHHRRSLERIYNDNQSLSHVIGYLGQISSDEFKLLSAEGYSRNSLIGEQGIEKEYDLQLQGKRGIKRRTVDSLERTVTEEEILKLPEKGSDLILTIDPKIQRLCEKSLGDRVGSVVVLKPDNGALLALVSYPWYDNNFMTASNSFSLYQQYLNNPQVPLINRTIQSTYAPASTFKVIMSTALLETEVVKPTDRVFCPGYKLIGRDNYFYCHLHSGHGSLDMAGAFAHSCNVYFYTMGYEKLGPGPDLIKKYAVGFGLGSVTGIDLPGEKPGLVPDAKWMKEQRNATWVGGDTVNISIGQGNLLVTPLQLATAISMVCNRGKIYKPHLLKEFRDAESGEIIVTQKPELLIQSDFKKKNLDKVALFMRGVVTSGTARYIMSTKAVESGGKTGTAEVGKKAAWHSWYVAMAPWDAPPQQQVVVVVMVEASNKYEFWSAKAANIILQGIFADQSYEEAIKTLRVWYAR